jgi:hypothetical protein
MASFTRKEMQRRWVKGITPLMPLGERGQKFLGQDVPDGYFVIKDWCIAQGITPTGSYVPDLTCILQGVQMSFFAATGQKANEWYLTREGLLSTMSYMNREGEFTGGALRQFPELQKLLKAELLKLPNGQAFIEGVQKITQYKDLFR